MNISGKGEICLNTVNVKIPGSTRCNGEYMLPGKGRGKNS